MPWDCTRGIVVLIKGAGDLASGVAARLYRAGFSVVMTELAQPLMVRRSVCFGEAVYEGRAQVEGIEAWRVASPTEAPSALVRLAALEAVEAGAIPVLVDPEASCLLSLRPNVLVDGIMAKRNTGTRREDAPLVIGLGPGFTAGTDCHVVIETNRGHWLGRAIWDGRAQADTGEPGEIAGRQGERVLRAPVNGVLKGHAQIGDVLRAGDLVASVDGQEIRARIDGVLRGLVRPGLQVASGIKVGDVDPRAERAHCFSISDKSLAVAGGVLEAILASDDARTRRAVL